MKERRLILAMISFLFVCGMNSVFAVNHGSLKVTGTSLYPQRNGAPAGAAVAGVTFDFKVVTVGSTTWAWTNLSAYGISGANWGSQLRWWQPAKTENNLEGRIAGTRQTYGQTTNLPSSTPVTITVFQALEGAPEGFTETDDFTYDYSTQNSAVAGDVTAPVLAEPVIQDQTATSITLQLSATDANDYFYYLSDPANNFETVSFLNNITIPLAPGQSYNFSIVAIDFSGNTSATKNVLIGAQAITNIVEGTANAVKFKLDSRSNDELVIFVENPDFLFADAFVTLTINGVAVPGEKKPSPAINQTTGTHAYRVVYTKADIPGWEEDAVLAINLGYIQCPILDWGTYVMTNGIITEGANTGLPILHKIGTGTDITLPSEIASVDITPKTATITEGGKVQFSAVAKTVIGDPVDGTTFTWSVDSGDASISATGEFTSAIVGTYTVTVTVEGKPIYNSATVVVEELSLESAYCDYTIGSGNALAKISFATRRDGRVVVEIAPYDPEAEDIEAGTYTAFRYFGWGDAIVQQITVNGIANTDYRYFTRTHNATNNENNNPTRTKLFLTPVEGMMHTGDIIKADNLILEYQTPENNNAYPNLTFTYTYGSYCGELETLPVVASITAGDVSYDQATVTVTATQGTFDIATINFTEDNDKIPAQSISVTGDNVYTLIGLTPDTDYSFTITVTDVDGNKSEPFATKWVFKTLAGNAIKDVNTTGLSLYLGSAPDVLYIKGLNSPTKVKVINIAGAVVDVQLSNGEVNVSKLASGAYLIQIDNRIFKFIKR
jgi:hypothetical protein